SAGGDVPGYGQSSLSSGRQSSSVTRQGQAENGFLKIGEDAFPLVRSDIPDFDLSPPRPAKEFLPVRGDNKLGGRSRMLQLRLFGVQRLPKEIPLEATPTVIPQGVGMRPIPFDQFASAFQVPVHEVLSRLPHVGRIQQPKLPARLRFGV